MTDAQEINFSISSEHRAVRDSIAEFIQHEVIPREHELDFNAEIPAALIRELRDKARAAQVYGPTLPRHLGGLELNWRGIAIALEEAGTSLLGPQALNCTAPDEGNMHLLELVASESQRQKYLVPLASGETRSCFAMTEPAPGAGSDPSQLCTTAHQDGDDWLIDGHKWFVTGADGAAFAIVMARTGTAIRGLSGASLFVVDAGTPGYTCVRRVGSLDHTIPGGHCELRFEQCRVPATAVLGEIDRGLEYAQARLGPARLTHCMRWLGIARRALQIGLDYAIERRSFGQSLAEHQQVQVAVADSEIELHAARLMIWHAAWVLDQGGAARHESSMAKVYVSETVNRVVDRMLQLCGALGISEDLPLSWFYREIRPFRIYDGPSEVHRASIARRLARVRAKA
jgi:acyl-CoA dehydrogenase